MLNPDKYIRAKYISLLSAVFNGSVQVPVFDMRVPKNVIAPTRIVITSQTKTQSDTTKCGHNWDCSITLDIINELPQGYASTVILDDIEEQISNLIDLQDGDIDITPFICYNTHTGIPTDLSYETPTLSIGRKVLRFNHKVGGIYPD